MVSEQLKRGDKLYYPSIKGIALICEVIDTSQDDIMVDIDGKSYYLPKKSVDSHAILIDERKAKSFVTQMLEDPDNKLVYVRYAWDETWVDQAYNEYCRKLGRIESAFVVESSTSEEPVLPDVSSKY